MKFTSCITLASAVAMLGAGTANAQQQEIEYPKGALGVQAMLNGDYGTAEKQLQDSRVAERDPGRLINLGVIMTKTGRHQAAALHFQQVLQEDAVDLILSDGRTASSHDIAWMALKQLGQP